ncbi:MAG: RHS repeat-associated core domain-containing protein, partial [Oscillospiraceae bacterium]|nr:RHS repeat-associated core domain-containing protein [Oscillospiraceae bacterium]
YRGYLQIACIDLTRSHHPGLWLITWDPTQPVATRPLSIQKDGTWYTYGLDLTKNVCEVFGPAGYIATTYTYSPFGSVTALGSVTQPILWSSELMDDELGMVYYNMRYYCPTMGVWNSYDILVDYPTYRYVNNSPYKNFDYLGMSDKYVTPKSIQKDRKSGKYMDCIYVIFYNSGTFWAEGEHNRDMSHVAVYTHKFKKAIGFNPCFSTSPEEQDKFIRVHFEDRVDYHKVLRCCSKTNLLSKVNKYLEDSVNQTRMYRYDKNGVIDKSRKFLWYFNGPNCATFAEQVV